MSMYASVCGVGLVCLIVAVFLWVSVDISQHSRYKYTALSTVIKLIWE